MPERDAVREAVARFIYDADRPHAAYRLAKMLGVEYSVNEQWTSAQAIADALLSRPAPEEK